MEAFILTERSIIDLQRSLAFIDKAARAVSRPSHGGLWNAKKRAREVIAEQAA